jgi:hypothetical protein
MAGLVPDVERRREIELEQPTVPLVLYETSVQIPMGCVNSHARTYCSATDTKPMPNSPNHSGGPSLLSLAGISTS